MMVNGPETDQTVLAPAQRLNRLGAAPGPGSASLSRTRPKTPLSEAALLTNSPGEPNLAAELRAEIDLSGHIVRLLGDVERGHRLPTFELLDAVVDGLGSTVLKLPKASARERAGDTGVSPATA